MISRRGGVRTRGASDARGRRSLRWAYWKAQLLPLLASSFVWVQLIALWPWLGWLLVAACTGYGIVWRRPLVLRWAWGLRPAHDRERDLVWRALVPIVALRGRRQPRVWVSRRPSPSVVVPTDHDVAVSERVLTGMVEGRFPDDQVAACVADAVGRGGVRGGVQAAGEVYCLPAAILAVVCAPCGRLLTWRPGRLLAVFVTGIAIVQSIADQRWVAAVGLTVLVAVIWWGTRWRRQYVAALEVAGDACVVENGLGEPWLRVLRGSRCPVQPERALRLAPAGHR